MALACRMPSRSRTAAGVSDTKPEWSVKRAALRGAQHLSVNGTNRGDRIMAKKKAKKAAKKSGKKKAKKKAAKK